MNKTYDLKKLFFLLMSKIFWIIFSVIVGAALMFSMSKFVIAPKYQSNISLYVKNVNSNAVDNIQSVNSNDLNVSKSLVNTYIVILKSDVVMDEISDKLMKKYSEQELSQYLTVSDGHVTNGSLKACYGMAAANQTEVLSITATTKNAELSQDLCNMIADVAPEFIIRVVGAGSVEKIGDAKLYPNAVSPNVKKYTIIGGLAGMLLAVMIIFLIDFFDNTIKDAEDLQTCCNKPIIGEIPHIGGKTKKKEIGKSSDKKKKVLFSNTDIPFSVTEGYKSLRTNVIFSMSTSDSKILALTSSLHAEGKSVTIANLAYTMAQADKKILLIDADMRKPVQHKNYELKNKRGLSTVLSGEASFEDCVNRGVAKNLDILTSGVIPPNPSELLASKKMRELAEKVESLYDYILIDTPPSLQMTDVTGLSDIIAGVTVVVAYGRTTYYEIQEVQKKLELGNCNLIGFVLNNIAVGSGSGYSSSYKYGYKYGYKYKYYAQNYKYEQAREKSAETETSDKHESEKKPEHEKKQEKKSDKKADKK